MMICKGSIYYIIFELDGKEVCSELTSVSDESDLWDDVFSKSKALYDFLDADKIVCITEDRPALDLIEGNLSELM